MTVTYEHNAQRYDLDIPFSPSEFTYGAVEDFRAAEQKYFNASTGEDADPIKAWQYLNKAIRFVVKGDLTHLPNFIGGENSESLIKSGYQIIPGDELSMARLYAHFVNMVESYEAEPEVIDGNFFLKWKGEKYYIEPDRANRLLDQKAYTNGEVLESLEFNRKTAEAIKQKGDPQGNLAFTVTLQQMAILLRKEGEVLPMHEGKRKAFIESRAKLFAELPFDVVIKVRFFLIGTYVEYLKTRPIIFS